MTERALFSRHRMKHWSIKCTTETCSYPWKRLRSTAIWLSDRSMLGQNAWWKNPSPSLLKSEIGDFKQCFWFKRQTLQHVRARVLGVCFQTFSFFVRKLWDIYTIGLQKSHANIGSHCTWYDMDSNGWKGHYNAWYRSDFIEWSDAQTLIWWQCMESIFQRISPFFNPLPFLPPLHSLIGRQLRHRLFPH